MAKEYNQTEMLNFTDEATLRMFDKLCKIGSDRRIAPNSVFDNIQYKHRVFYDEFNLMIGDCFFMIPPEFIAVMSESNSGKSVIIRQENTQKTRGGYHKRTIIMDLVFYGQQQINGYEVDGPEGTYYVDGLRQLLAQFKCAPFLPILNSTINDVYNIWSVALQDITIATVNGFPDLLTAQVTLLEVNLFPYLEMPGAFFIDSIDWDLFRFYYQRMLTSKHEYKKLQPIPNNKEHNRFKISILNPEVLSSGKISKILDVLTDKTIVMDGTKTNYITWVNSEEMDIHISEFQCKYANMLTCIQLADSGEPTMQYLGGMDTIYQITFETSDISIAQAVEQCQISNDLYTRQNQKFQSLGFVKLESELVEFCGGLFVAIENVTVNTVPGYPGLFNVSMQAVAYDIAQGERESLNGFLPFDKDEVVLKKMAIDQTQNGLMTKIAQDLYAEQKLRESVEMYPDLKLPTYKEVDEVINKIAKFRLSNVNAGGDKLTPYPLKNYPRVPTVSLRGKVTGENVEIPADTYFPLSKAKGIDTNYDLYVDPDFYVFYPNSYQDIEQLNSGIFTDTHKNIINDKKDVKYTGNTYEDNFNDSGVYEETRYKGSSTASIEKLVTTSRKYLGCPYVWGACGTKTAGGQLSFDCSGYISYIMKECGLLTSRLTTADMPKKTDVFETISLDNIKRGDLVHRYIKENGKSTGHVALYLGDNKIIEARDAKNGVIEGDYSSSRYSRGLRIKAIQTGETYVDTSNTTSTGVSAGAYSAPTLSTAISIIYENEGGYGTSTANDNGAISVGRGQWHADRAKSILQQIIQADPSNSKKILGDALFNQIVDNSVKWKNFIPSSAQNNAIKEVLNLSVSKAIQDKQMEIDVAAYIQKGQSYGLTDQKALIYFADGVHQYGENSKSWKQIAQLAVSSGGSLDSIYNATKTVLKSAYASRRKTTYDKLNGSKTVSTKESDSYVTYTVDNSAGIVDNVPTLTKDEFKEIVSVIGKVCSGEEDECYLAIAQLLYDRVTNKDKKWGTLSDILKTDQFNIESGSVDNTKAEKAADDVFCFNKKWNKNSVWYFTDTNSNPDLYEKYAASYTKMGSVNSKTFFGNEIASSDIVYKIEGDLGSMMPGEASVNRAYTTESIAYSANIEEITDSDVEDFARPIMIKTFEMMKESKDSIIEKMNKDRNIVNSSFVNQYQSGAKGTLLKAFPTYLFCVLDDQNQWFDGRKLWTNYYTQKAVVDIQTHESTESSFSTATITVSNSYHNLDRTSTGLSSYNLKNDKGYLAPVRFIYEWTGVLLGLGPKLTQMICDLHAEIYDHALLREGARIHLRIGYGSDPLALEPVMNGNVNGLTLGDQISIVAVSDGNELLNDVISAKKNTNNSGWFGLFGLGESQEASNIIANIMCDRTNNLINYLWKGTFEASRHGIEHFGLFKRKQSMEQYREADSIIGWQEQYDILKNIYRSSYKPSQYIYNKGILGADEEPNIVFSTYNKTPWDVFQICAQTTPEYILKTGYHQFDSRLFFGLPTWLERYRYNAINDELYEECKSAAQAHYIDSMTDIIDNQVRVTSRDSYTNARVMYQLGSSSVTTGTLFSDRTIDFSKQKTKIIDSAVVQDALGPDWVYEHTFYKIGKETAKKMGVSNLLIGWEQQYRGSLVILGNPGIHANDYLLTNDTHVNMFGVSKAREIFHSFNSNTGFVTTVVPGMIGFSTSGDSGMIITMENYLKILTAFASYTYVRRQINNNYQNNAVLYSSLQSTIKALQAKHSFDGGLNVMSGITGATSTVLTAGSVYKWGSALIKTVKTIKAGKSLVDAFEMAEAINTFKKSYDLLKTAKNLKNAVAVIKTGAAAANAYPVIGQIIYIAVWLICDAIIEEAIEWLENQNVITLLPMWFENHPFVAGVKDGEHILVMKSNANGTEENKDDSTDDLYSVEDN